MIALAVKKGDLIYVYDEKGRTLCRMRGDSVIGFTATTFSVQKGKIIYIYDEKGRRLSIRTMK